MGMLKGLQRLISPKAPLSEELDALMKKEDLSHEDLLDFLSREDLSHRDLDAFIEKFEAAFKERQEMVRNGHHAHDNWPKMLGEFM